LKPEFSAAFFLLGRCAVSDESIDVFGHSRQAFVIKQRKEGKPIADISQATYISWKNKYVGLLPTEVKQFEYETSRLKKTVADRMLDREIF
jgi:putative transposase